ncbi:MAG TPA: hypothetical protein VIM41_09200, partial [Gammaproteobacteria bacterium]
MQEFPFLECNYSPVGGAGVSCRGTPQVRPCRLLWAIPGPHPAGALRATGFVPGESVDCGHPWP